MSETTGRPPYLLFLLFFLAILAGFFANIWGIPLFDLDEGAFSEATREMFANQDFLTTTLNGAPRYDKPILFYWLQAASVTLFGWQEWALRLPSSIAASFWALATLLFVSRIKGIRTGLHAGILIATSLLISLIGKTAIADATLNCFLACSMFSIYLYFQEGRRHWVLSTFFFMGLGFLTKGPVAIVVPAIVSLLFFLSVGQWRAWLTAIGSRSGWLILLAINLPWYLAVLIRDGSGFIEGFFLQHNLGRFDNAMEGHTGNLLYYIPIILIGTLPYTGLLIPALRNCLSAIKDPFNRFMWLWFLFVLVLFSLSGTKLPHYINYGLTGLVILMALQVETLRARSLALLPAIAFIICLFFLPEMLQQATQGISQPFYKASFTGIYAVFSWPYRLALILAILSMIWLYRAQHIALSNRLIVVGIISSLALPVLVIPGIGKMTQTPAKRAGLFMRDLPDQNVVSWHLNMPSFSVYSQRIVPRRAPVEDEIVFTSPAYLSELTYATEVLFQERGIVLARIGKAKQPAPETPPPENAIPSGKTAPLPATDGSAPETPGPKPVAR